MLGLGDDLFLSEVDAWAGFAGIEQVTDTSVSEAILNFVASQSKRGSESESMSGHALFRRCLRQLVKN